jgi:hypothetical protein
LEREATAFFKARSAWIELMKSVESVERGKRFKEKLAAFGV